MLKVIGIFVILIGTIGAIYSWKESQHMQIRHLKELCRFFQRARYRFEAEKLACVDFFSTYQTDDEALNKMLKSLVFFLNSHQYPTGEAAWDEAFTKNRDLWGLSKEATEIVLSSGKAFFGKNLAENIEQMGIYEKQLSDYLSLQRKIFQEKNKVFTPVGFLGGIMLVIILI